MIKRLWCKIWERKKRGLIHGLEAMGGGVLNKGVLYTGPREVKIIEEKNGKFKVMFLDHIFQKSGTVPKWWDKECVEVL